MDSSSDKDREYYEKKKYDFANNFSYYGNRDKKWGEEYGYTLADPYTEEEVSEYENKYDIRLPQIFRDYLINISRETMGCYPCVFDLVDGSNEPFKMYFKGDNKIAQRCLCNEVEFDHDCVSNLDLDSLSREELNTKGLHANYFIITHNNGCSDDTFLCVKGKYYGYRGYSGDGGDYYGIDTGNINIY